MPVKPSRIFIALLLAVLLFGISALTSCAEGNQMIMTVGGKKITRDEYMYFYNNYRTQLMNNTGSADFDSIEAEIEEALRQKYAKLILAEEHNISLTEDEKKILDDAVSYYIESYGGKEAFQAALAENHLTEQLFRDSLAFESIETNLRAYLCDEYTGNIVSDDATVLADIRKNFIHATQILILNEAGDNIADNYALAQEIRARAAAGEDFDALIREYNEDPHITSGSRGYYFTDGQMIAAFEDAAKALAIGEISDVVLSENGYHIIKRLPLSDDDINQDFEELRNAYKAREYNTQIEEKAAALEIRYGKHYEQLKQMLLEEENI